MTPGPTGMAETPLVQCVGLSREFRRQGKFLEQPDSLFAVRGVNLEIARGGTLGIVGESGCGKSSLSRMVVGLLRPSNGDVLFQGLSLYNQAAHADYASFRRGLAGSVQMVFQDPASSLNPRMRVGQSVAEPLLCSSAWRGQELAPGEKSADRYAIRDRVEAILVQVGLDADAAGRYPHEFSGGQRQRIAIARALVTRPAFVVCDEPTSSLDASIQSQILNLLKDMQEELALTYMFISHDLGVVRHMSDRVAVMYRGLVVEEGESEDLFNSPRHPYTRLLLDSVPGKDLEAEGTGAAHPEENPCFCERTGTAGISAPDTPAARENADSRKAGDLPEDGGEAPDSSGPEAREDRENRCLFAPRCPHAVRRCRENPPEMLSVPVPDLPGGRVATRRVRCFPAAERTVGKA